MLNSYLLDNRCLVCNNSSKDRVCQSCIDSLSYYPKENFITFSNNFYFNNFYTLLNFNNSLKKMIHLYKFENKRFFATLFSELLLKNFSKEFFNNYDYIILTPLHNKKLKKRGFNQTTLIIEKIVKKDKIFFNIERVKNTKQQSLLNSREERIDNLDNSFMFKNSSYKLIKDKKILIFDDIFTTGTTVNSIAKLLYFAEAKLIDVLTIGIA